MAGRRPTTPLGRWPQGSLGRFWGRPALALALLLGLLMPAAGEVLPPPDGPVVLTLSGKIGRTNGPGVARFDRPLLEALGTTRLVTHTAWHDDAQTFEGVLMRVLLEAVAAEGARVHAVALNDYDVDIPISDFQRYDVVLAWKRNGADMRVRDKGPLWLVYPRDQNPELDRAEIWRRWIWQLERLEVR